MSEPAVIVTFVGTDPININGVLIVFTRSGMESPPIIWQVHCKDRERATDMTDKLFSAPSGLDGLMHL
jgi:hypothetical protein